MGLTSTGCGGGTVGVGVGGGGEELIPPVLGPEPPPHPTLKNKPKTTLNTRNLPHNLIESLGAPPDIPSLLTAQRVQIL